jgi:hypothetical protein
MKISPLTKREVPKVIYFIFSILFNS